jgi:hypothetical protein
MENEPELPDVPQGDRMVLRNVLYSIWALLKQGGSECISWNVKVLDRCYEVCVQVGTAFAIGTEELEEVRKVSIGRVEWVGIVSPKVAVDVTERRVGCVVCARVCDSQQRISYTETDIVRIVQRKKSWFQALKD